jgi:hypothetical protein
LILYKLVKKVSERKALSLNKKNAMDISSKYKIVEKIIQSNDEGLLNEINSLLGLSGEDFWDDLPIDVKEDIEQAKAELDRGEGIPHSQVMSEIKARFLNK